MTDQNEFNRFGSARTSSTQDYAKANMLRQQPDSIFLSFDGSRPTWYSGAGGMVLTAGARSGKFVSVQAYLLCTSTLTGNVVVLDPKGEGAAVSQDQSADGKFQYFWNPAHLHGLRCDNCNPVDFAHISDPRLVSNLKLWLEQVTSGSGSQHDRYFVERCCEYGEAIAYPIIDRDSVLTLPEFYHALNLLAHGGPEWLDFAYLMHKSAHPLSRRVEAEIAAGREDSSGGFKGIVGELLKSFACLSDPALMASVSPPFRFSFADMCNSDQPHQIHLMPPAENIGFWRAILKSMFTSTMIHKSRAPQAPRQTWVLDECATLESFPLLPRLFTYGAGIGIRPIAVFQSTDQMKAVGPNAETIIPASAACQMFFGIRDIESAQRISAMAGSQSLRYDDEIQQSRARLSKQQAAHTMLSGADPIEAALAMKHYAKSERHRSVQHRLLMTPDEVLNMNEDACLVFADGLPGPAILKRRPYWDVRWMAGRYHPNPYHPPLDRVSCKGWLGLHWRRVVERPVEAEFAHLPQYQNGIRSRIEK